MALIVQVGQHRFGINIHADFLEQEKLTPLSAESFFKKFE